MTISYPPDFQSYGVAWMIAELMEPIAKTLEFVGVDMPWADGVVCVLMIDSQDAPSMELECQYDSIKKLKIIIWSWKAKQPQTMSTWDETMETVFDVQDEAETEKLTELFREHCEDKYVALQYCPTQKSKS